METDLKLKEMEESPLRETDEEKSDGSDSSTDIKKRETWKGKLDFLMACCGFSIGLGNVWKFPFLCYRNGGGAFLIPYFLCCIFGGIPMFLLEVSIGQFMSEGGMNAYRICPLFQGIGVASMVISFLVNSDYNTLLAWAFYYFFASMTTKLPWSDCSNEWNSPECSIGRLNTSAGTTKSIANVTSNGDGSLQGSDVAVDVAMLGVNNTLIRPSNIVEVKSLVYNISDNATSVGTVAEKAVMSFVSDPVTEYWERKVLAISDGVDQPGILKWDLVLCLLLAWVLVYFCIWKGIRGSGKVMYFTVPCPYILMFILLVRGLTLPGAIDGMKYYLIPDFSKLLEYQVWADAGNQVFYSYSLSTGVLVALGSYNKFKHNAYRLTGTAMVQKPVHYFVIAVIDIFLTGFNSGRDCLVFAGMNSFTSLLSGFVIFSVLGFMAHEQGVSIENVAESGPGLAFIAYPEAVAQMPVSPLWSVIFFLMVILLGLDSQFVGVEGVITFIVDLYPNVLRRGYRREMVIAVVCIVSFLVGLSMVCQGGMYVFQLFDYYSVSRTVFVIAFIELIVISYIYGIDRFMKNLEMMYGQSVALLLKLCWMFITPVFIFSLFVVGVLSYSNLTYDRKSVTYHFPKWAVMIGWVMACASIVWIPIVAVFKLYREKGTLKERLRESIKPKLRKHQLLETDNFDNVKFIGD